MQFEARDWPRIWQFLSLQKQISKSRTAVTQWGVLRRQASLEETARPVGLARDRPAAGAADVAMPGLRNETGEYNCFLNVIIQCLWHCSDFRAAIMALPPDMLKGAALCSPQTRHVSQRST